MRLKPDAAWSPFTAEQRFTASPPGFVWDATVRMMPLVPVRVRDSYVAGEGRMLGRIAGVVTVVNQGGTSEMKLGALARAKPSSSERFGVLEHHLAREACGLTMLGLGVRPADARQSRGVRIPPLTPSGNLARYAATTHCITCDTSMSARSQALAASRDRVFRDSPAAESAAIGRCISC